MRRTILALLAVVLLLSSCGKSSTSADGYYFEEATWVHTSFETSIVLVETQAELTALAAKHGRNDPPGRQIAAFSTINPETGKCTIYMLDPKHSYQPEWYGHELTHCVYGLWHKAQP